MTEQPGAPKEIIEKAIALNSLTKQRNELKTEIREWMKEVGYLKAGIYDKQQIIPDLDAGRFETDEAITYTFNSIAEKPAD